MISDGHLRVIRYDLLAGDEAPKRGNYLVSKGTRGVGTVYKICRVRPVKRRKILKSPRYILYVIPCGRGEGAYMAIPHGVRIFDLRWYPRKGRRMSFEEYMRRGLHRSVE